MSNFIYDKDSTNIGAIKANNTFKNNTSGHRGVTWHKGSGKWNVRLQFRKVTHELGYYSDKQEAIKVRKNAEIRYFGKYLDSLNEGM